jgi:hypothetical protein
VLAVRKRNPYGPHDLAVGHGVDPWR